MSVVPSFSELASLVGDTEPDKPENSWLSTFFLLLNTMIGSGILVQAYVFRKAGIILAIVEYALVLIMNYRAARILVLAADRCEEYNYSFLCAAAFGPSGHILHDISVGVLVCIFPNLKIYYST